MSDILLSWLRQDVGIDVTNIEQQFSNGYLWGSVFAASGLQPDMDRFVDQRDPDSMVNNYTRLQPTFKRLGVTMNTRMANSLMREEPGVALRLLYAIKQNLGQVNKDLDKYKHTGRLGRELGAAQEPNRTLLEVQQYRSSKQSFEQGNMRFFEETMRRNMPDTNNHLMESMHLRKFNEKQYKQDTMAQAGLDAERAAFNTGRETFRTGLRDNMATHRTDKIKTLGRDAAVHASLLRRKEDAEREELRVELALAEATRRRGGEGVQRAAADVSRGIDAFEINMKRLLKGDNEDDALSPATTHSPLEHMGKLRAMATGTSKLLEETAGYMSTVRSQRVDDVATKREREARRRRLLVEQQAAAGEAEAKSEAEALLVALARQSGEEQRLAARLWQLGQEKEVIRANRELREKQYAERRLADWDDTLRRELELHRSMRSQYQSQAAVEMEAWRVTQQGHNEARTEKHRKMCRGMAWQLVQLAERAAEYREKTGEAKVPINEWRRWCTMFVVSDPELGEPVTPGQLESPKLDEALARAAVADWLACLGEYEREGVAPVAPSAPLGEIIAELEARARPATDPGELPPVQQMPLKLAVIGAPFSGKTSVAQALAQRFKLKLIDPEALVTGAIAAADAWLLEHPLPILTTLSTGMSAPLALPGDDSGLVLKPVAEDDAAEGGEAVVDQSWPSPPRKVAMGLELRTALAAGQALPDAALVPLVVLAMEEALTWVPPVLVLEGKPGAKGAKPTTPKSVNRGAAPVEDTPLKEPQGFVVDGFPRTVTQAVLLERALTGLDLQGEQAVVDGASRVAPPPPQALPQLARPLTSGLDAVLLLGLATPEVALRRALGRRLDPQTGRMYHLEFDPPAATDPGLAARLVEVADPSNDAAQVQHRLAAFQAVSVPLDEWNKRFSRLRRPVDGSGTVVDVLAAATDAATGVLRAKAAVASSRAAAEAAHKARCAAEKAQEYAELARSHAEGAANELLVAKKAEVQAQALLDGTLEPSAGKSAPKGGKGAAPVAVADPAAVELLKAQSAAKCAEQLKVCRGAATDAASYAERAAGAAATAAEAVERARLSLGDAEISATAEVEARAAAVDAEAAQAAAAEAAAKAEVACQAAEQAVREALKIVDAHTVEPDACLELARPAGEAEAEAAAALALATPPPTPVPGPVPLPVAGVLVAEWAAVEGYYLEGVGRVLANLAERNEAAVAHYDGVRGRFKELLAAPDHRAVLVAKFQKGWNAIDVDARKLKDTQAELVLRSEELREGLWALCDQKMEGAEVERSKVAADSFVADHSALLAQFYTSIAQVELDRFFATLSFLHGATVVRYGVLQPESLVEPFSAGTAPDLLSGAMPPELKEKLDEKSKTVIPIPPQLSQLATRSPALGMALKIAYASGLAAVASLAPPVEDLKKVAKKEAPKPKAGKGAAANVPAADIVTPVSPALQAAITAEVMSLGGEEGRILEQRLFLLAERATASLEGLAGLSQRTLDTLGSWVKARYQAECSAALALDKVCKSAALAGEQLAADLRLEDDGTLAVVDEGSIVVPPHPGFPPPRPRERPPPAAVCTVEQLAALTAQLLELAPQGFIKLGELVEVLGRAIASGLLPDAWQGTGSMALTAAVQLLDPVHSGYADWRQLLVCLVGAAFPLVLQATCADMADQCEMLSEGDKDKDGLMAIEEWTAVELWFQYRAFVPGDAADLEAEFLSEEERASARKTAYDRAAGLKQVLWDAFSFVAPEGSPVAGTRRLDLRAVLLNLCTDMDQFQGIKKAFSVAANLGMEAPI